MFFHVFPYNLCLTQKASIIDLYCLWSSSIPLSAEISGAMVYKGILSILITISCFQQPKLLAALTDSQRIFALEKQVDELKTSFKALEPLLVARYGLIRQCEKPIVPNGLAKCPTKLEPGSCCSVICNPGYIPTPGKSSSSCSTGGVWCGVLSWSVRFLCCWYQGAQWTQPTLDTLVLKQSQSTPAQAVIWRYQTCHWLVDLTEAYIILSMFTRINCWYAIVSQLKRSYLWCHKLVRYEQQMGASLLP